MTATPLRERAPHTKPAQSAPRSAEALKHELERILTAKLEQGYQVESQTDTEAVLVIRGRKRWFGLRGHEASTRQRISFDDHDRLQTRAFQAPVEAR